MSHTNIKDINGDSLPKIQTLTFTTRADDMSEPLPKTYNTTNIIGNNLVFSDLPSTTDNPFYVASTLPKADSFLINSSTIKLKFNNETNFPFNLC